VEETVLRACAVGAEQDQIEPNLICFIGWQLWKWERVHACLCPARVICLFDSN